MTHKVSGNLLLDSKLIFKEAGISDSMKVADLGCGGHGYFVFPLAEIIGRSGMVYAVDILKVMLENVQRRVQLEGRKNVKTIWSDIEKFGATQIDTSSLDRVFLINVLFQTTKRVEALREAIRLLKKNGKLVLVDWKNVALPFGPGPKDKVKAEALKQGAHKLGLEFEKEFSAGEYHYGLIFKKL